MIMQVQAGAKVLVQSGAEGCRSRTGDADVQSRCRDFQVQMCRCADVQRCRGGADSR